MMMKLTFFVDDDSDIFLTQAYQYHRSLQHQQVSTSRPCNPIYRECDIAEAFLLGDLIIPNIRSTILDVDIV